MCFAALSNDIPEAPEIKKTARRLSGVRLDAYPLIRNISNDNPT